MINLRNEIECDDEFVGAAAKSPNSMSYIFNYLNLLETKKDSLFYLVRKKRFATMTRLTNIGH